MTGEYYTVVETRGNGTRCVIGFTRYPSTALNQVRRLFHLDPFQASSRHAVELAQYKPGTGQDYDIDGSRNAPVTISGDSVEHVINALTGYHTAMHPENSARKEVENTIHSIKSQSKGV